MEAYRRGQTEASSAMLKAKVQPHVCFYPTQGASCSLASKRRVSCRISRRLSSLSPKVIYSARSHDVCIVAHLGSFARDCTSVAGEREARDVSTRPIVHIPYWSPCSLHRLMLLLLLSFGRLEECSENTRQTLFHTMVMLVKGMGLLQSHEPAYAMPSNSSTRSPWCYNDNKCYELHEMGHRMPLQMTLHVWHPRIAVVALSGQAEEEPAA